MQFIPMNKQINSFNLDLIKLRSNYSINEYLHQLNNIFYKIDKLFIDKLYKLINKETCCIPYTYLEEFNIINTINKYSDVLKLFNKHKFIKDIDYVYIKEENKYYIHPDVFNELMMTSCKTNIYRNYYIILQKYIKFYNKYKIKLLNSNKKLLRNELTEIKNTIKNNNKEFNEIIDSLMQKNNVLNNTILSLSIHLLQYDINL